MLMMKQSRMSTSRMPFWLKMMWWLMMILL